MNRGVLLKAMREALPVTVLCGLGLLGFEILFANVINSFGRQLSEQWLQMSFFQNILKALLGTNMDGYGLEAFRAMGWVHPVLLAIIWAHAISICTRTPAGEVDRGTADVLFGLPVSRWQVYIGETAVFAATGLLVIAGAMAGTFLGEVMVGLENPTGISVLALVGLNLFALYLAVGGLAFLISALSDRRGKAIALSFGLVLASFFWNFLAQFWDPAAATSWLSILHYFQPMGLMSGTGLPVADISVLLLTGSAFWLTGGIVLARRDICTT